MQFSQHLFDVVTSAGASYEPRCRILNRLQTPKETVRDTAKQRISYNSLGVSVLNEEIRVRTGQHSMDDIAYSVKEDSARLNMRYEWITSAYMYFAV